MVDIDARYANVLLKVALAENSASEVAEDMSLLRQGFSACAESFNSPIFTVKEQTDTVACVLDGKLHPLTMRFMYLLASMRRLGNIARIAAVFEHLSNKAAGFTELTITYCESLPKETEAALIKAAQSKGLIKARAADKLKIYKKADKGLLGGFVMECDGISWDSSLRTRLTDMAKTMRKSDELLMEVT